ncbi:hypothetical protein HWN40_10645 [Methanolobus zinderi]|uniref:Uncharacterized protein n=1 Tax=Methanolobus zinderi TaxID=536044 RepID=A0A7D5EG58_9EURY|nr:hypothetical protein [Methanolobus zinderi]QLC50654.1 hypothetical protein HWN40_10645 [Methanolobus zinderi]
MESMRYMSFVFRGLVEEYNNSGARPSVFMDAGGNLQVYLCDPIVEENREEYGIDLEGEYDVNGGQFTEMYDALKLIAPAPLEAETNLNLRKKVADKR